jgi:hypothetical protein
MQPQQKGQLLESIGSWASRQKIQRLFVAVQPIQPKRDSFAVRFDPPPWGDQACGHDPALSGVEKHIEVGFSDQGASRQLPQGDTARLNLRLHISSRLFSPKPK